MPTDKPRVTFTISEEKLAQVDAYRFDGKFKNQTQAILSLIEKGLEGSDQSIKKAPAISAEAMQVAKDYDGLAKPGQRLVRVVIDELKKEEEG